MEGVGRDIHHNNKNKGNDMSEATLRIQVGDQIVSIPRSTAKRPVGIKTKLMAALLALALVPITVSTLATLTTSQPQMQKLAADNLIGNVKAYKTAVAQWEEGNTLIGTLAASGLAKIDVNDIAGQKAFQENFVKVISNGSAITTFATNFNGIQISRDNDAKLSNISERNYFRGAIDRGVGKMEIAFSKSTGKYTTLSGYRYNPAGSVGTPHVLGVNWNPEFFAKAAKTLTLGHTGKAAIVSDKGLFVYSTDAKAGSEVDRALFDKLPISGSEAVLFEHVDSDGKGWLVASEGDDALGVKFVVMQNSAQALGPVITQKAYAIWGVSFALVFAFGLAIFILRTFVTPVIEIASALREIAIKPPSALATLRIPNIGRKDELGVMARAADHIRKNQFIGYKTRARLAIGDAKRTGIENGKGDSK